ncbi:MAG: hypothetical protein PVH95_05755 [Anaerolineae bacterium]|jgi:hypothetical protein
MVTRAIVPSATSMIQRWFQFLGQDSGGGPKSTAGSNPTMEAAATTVADAVFAVQCQARFLARIWPGQATGV